MGMGGNLLSLLNIVHDIMGNSDYFSLRIMANVYEYISKKVMAAALHKRDDFIRELDQQRRHKISDVHWSFGQSMSAVDCHGLVTSPDLLGWFGIRRQSSMISDDHADGPVREPVRFHLMKGLNEQVALREIEFLERFLSLSDAVEALVKGADQLQRIGRATVMADHLQARMETEEDLKVGQVLEALAEMHMAIHGADCKCPLTERHRLQEAGINNLKMPFIHVKE